MVPAVSHRHLIAEDRFDPGLVQMRFVLKNVALDRFFSEYLNFSGQYNSTNTHSLINLRRYIMLAIYSVLTYMQKEKMGMWAYKTNSSGFPQNK